MGMPRENTALSDSILRRQFPLCWVSWADAKEFCAGVAELTGMAVRLPTEREWEYACRSGRREEYADAATLDDLDRIAWTWRNCRQEQPIGTKQPNYFGLYDMLGNAREWCEDIAGDGDFCLQLRPSAYRIVRGGSFGCGRLFLSPYARFPFTANDGQAGFRVLIVISPLITTR
jgi:formylglycine-generating enzyme required for sulfatase activity